MAHQRGTPAWHGKGPAPDECCCGSEATVAGIRRLTARRIAAALFVATAALFAVGVAAEGEGGGREPVAVEQAERSGESAEAQGAGEEAEEAEEGYDESGEGEETVLGVDIESPTTVAFAVIVSLALAGGLWLTDRRWIALAAAAGGAAFALFDVLEVLRQLDESRSGRAALAAVVAAGHVAAGAAAGFSVGPQRRRPRQGPPGAAA